MKNLYDENYFNSGNYIGGYLGRSERYKRLSEEIYFLLRDVFLLDKDDNILDYGCAAGLLLDGFKELGFEKTFGYDISEWALDQVDKDSHHIIELEEKQKFEMAFFLDVLEHMTDSDICDVFNKLNFEKFIVRIPCSTDGKTFHLPQSRLDKTHINCKIKKDWIALFDKLGYELVFRFNLHQIYDTDGVFCALFKLKG